MHDPRELLIGAYREFNARALDSVLARLHPDVVWPNGMEGGFVYGRGGVRDYWSRQWEVLDPVVEPVEINQDGAGRWVVEVHQVVKDRNGKLLVDAVVHHSYQVENGLIVRMDIE